jgi:hypothetical protein
MDEGTGTSESGEEGWAGVRLCNLVAQGALTSEGLVQAGSGKGINGAGVGTVRDYLLQAVQDRDSGYRAGDRNGRCDVGHGQGAVQCCSATAHCGLAGCNNQFQSKKRTGTCRFDVICGVILSSQSMQFAKRNSSVFEIETLVGIFVQLSE